MIYPVGFALAAGALGLLLGWLHGRARHAAPVLAQKIEEALPGTQCGLCGYPGCRPYAEAVAAEEAPITLCPPGGERLVARLSDLLNTDAKGQGAATGAPEFSQVARVRESDCIGCALCLPACPFDAIVGAQGSMHTVATGLCTGCGLCVPPCPVDCIEMVAVTPAERVVMRDHLPGHARDSGAGRVGRADAAHDRAPPL